MTAGKSALCPVANLRQGFEAGGRVPVGTHDSDIIEERWYPVAGEWLDAIKIGLSIELLKLRK